MHRDSCMVSSRLGTVGDGGRELKLFGVRISGEGEGEEEEEVMRKSASTGNLVSCEAAAAAAEHGGDNGYLSDGGLIGGSRKRRGAHDRKRGIPWTEEEHKTFLAGLKKLGKGDWRGISRNFVPTRTPTQVASHAQKYFLRQINPSKKKRRSSLFDVVIDEMAIIPKTGEASSLKKTPEAAKEANHPCQNDRSVANPTLNSIQAFIQCENASRAIPVKTNCINVLNSISFNLMQVGLSGSKNDQIIPYPELGKPVFHADHSAFVPDFLKLSLANPRVLSESSATSPSTENRGLELSIGLPWPQSLAELSSSGAAGAISVV